jgi:hypothetical protein
MSIVSAIFFESIDMAFSNAIFLTILLHSLNFVLASTSLGRALVTFERKINKLFDMLACLHQNHNNLADVIA